MGATTGYYSWIKLFTSTSFNWLLQMKVHIQGLENGSHFLAQVTKNRVYLKTTG